MLVFDVHNDLKYGFLKRKYYENEKKSKIIEIKEEVTIEQDDKKIILEKVTGLEFWREKFSTYKAPKGKSWDAVVKELERQGANVWKRL
jgi:site-specific DNA-cytosine methylase